MRVQENKYLQNLVDKVKAFRPSIILVQKSVSRLALEDLYNLGIVVVVNVKPTVMARVARSVYVCVCACMCAQSCLGWHVCVCMCVCACMCLRVHITC